MAVDHAELQGEIGVELKVPNASGKGRVLYVLIFVGMIVSGGSYVWGI